MPTNAQSTTSSTVQSDTPTNLKSKSSTDTAVGFILIAIIIIIAIYFVQKYRAKNNADNITKTPNTDKSNATNITVNQSTSSSYSVQENTSLYVKDEDEYKDDKDTSDTKDNNDDETFKLIYERISQSEKDISNLQKMIDDLCNKYDKQHNRLEELNTLVEKHEKFLKTDFAKISELKGTSEKHEEWLKKQYGFSKGYEEKLATHERILNELKNAKSNKINFLTIIIVILLLLLIGVIFFYNQ